MLSIGEFSKICKVSTKTLRYYDEIGLINPSKINQENGYGYENNGPLYEVYITDPTQTSNEDEFITEIYYPVKKK